MTQARFHAPEAQEYQSRDLHWRTILRSPYLVRLREHLLCSLLYNVSYSTSQSRDRNPTNFHLRALPLYWIWITLSPALDLISSTRAITLRANS
jgi:hypothetical protein